MRRTVILLAVFSIMAACLSGCILSTDPVADTTITLKVGQTKTFSVSGFFNNAYSWIKGSDTVATGESYTYIAAAEDVGTFTIKVQTTELFSTTPIVKEWTMVVTENLAPTADAGGDQDVLPGAVVQLDGSASDDQEGDTLTYLWEIVAQPAGSTATLDANDIAKPSFTPVEQGTYTIRLTVNDGNSNASDVVIVRAYTDNEPPTANAGADQDVLFGTVVQLNGTGSYDPGGGGTLTYSWSIDSGPAGTTATLDDPTSATPSFMPDQKGVYVVRLVVNDSRFDSNVAQVTITVYNHAPVANAGTDTVYDDLGDVAELDGSDSADPDGTELTYAWTLENKPIGSAAALVNPASENPTFTLDKKGSYVVKLVVSDGDLTSEDTVEIRCSNQVPTANAGTDQSLPFGSMFQLNGSASSDPDGDLLTYAWSVYSRPDGSTAAPSNATIMKPTFTPDKKGTYVLRLVVTDSEGISSAPDDVEIVTTNHAPVANAGGDFNQLLPGTATLNGLASSDADGDNLSYAWTLVSAPIGSTAALVNPTSATPSFTPTIIGDYTFELVVNDGEASSTVDQVIIHAYNNAPVASAGADQTLPYGKTAYMDGSASSDPDGSGLSYAWTFDSLPSGSAATFSNAADQNPSLTLDKEGRYIIRLTVSDGNMTNTATVTIIAIEGWENGMGSWTTHNDSGGDFNAHEISETQRVSPTHSYYVEGKGLGVNGWMLSRSMTSAYVYSISFWQYWDYTSPGNDSIHTYLYINGSQFCSLPVNGDTDKDVWVYRTITINQNVTSIGFFYDNYCYVDKMYIDDILVKTWN